MDPGWPWIASWTPRQQWSRGIAGEPDDEEGESLPMTATASGTSSAGVVGPCAPVHRDHVNPYIAPT